MCAHFLFFPSQQTRDFSSRWEIVTWHVKGHPSVSAHNWTVSDHQWSKALKLRIGFTLRMRNCVSSSWFERLRISDRKFVNHTTEMILWSMILKLTIRAVEFTRGQPKQLVLVDFCSASLQRHWALIVGTFIFDLVPLGWKSPADCCCTNSTIQVSDLTTRAGGKIRCQRHLYHVLCTLDFQFKLVCAFLAYSCQHVVFI